MKRLYRAPLDWVEMLATGSADVVVVNSKFTAKVYREAFPTLVDLPKVIYPAADFDSFTPPDWDAKLKKRGELQRWAKLHKSFFVLEIDIFRYPFELFISRPFRVVEPIRAQEKRGTRD